MIVHKCDLCGNEMTRWIIININLGAAKEWINMSDLIKEKCVKEICIDCYFNKIKENLSYE